MNVPPPAADDHERGPRDRVVQDIRQLIAAGGIAAGDRVPTVRELSRRLAVDKGTVLRAYRHLEGLGVVRRRGVGPRARLIVAESGARPAPFGDLVAVVSTHSVEVAGQLGAQPGREAGQLAGILEVLTAAHRPALVVSPDLFAANGRRWLADGLAGVIALRSPGAQVEALLEAHAHRVPVIADSAYMPVPWCVRVAHDHAAGAAALVGLLVADGRKRILPLGFTPTAGATLSAPWALSRLAGYRRACAAAGIAALEPLPCQRMADFPDEATFRAQTRGLVGALIEQLVGPQAVDAIMAVNDGWVPTIAEAARLAGRKVHADLAIVGYDDGWAWTPERQWSPVLPFATIDKDNRGRGRKQAELLLQGLAGTPLPPAETVVPFVLLRPTAGT